MRTLILAATMGALLAGGAAAQRATEQYIPIGHSPGALTMQGALTEPVTPAAVGEGNTVTMQPSVTGAREISYMVGPNTRIYVDRSALRLPSLVGSIDDLQAGRVVEVCVPDPTSRVALWIKVRP